MEVRTEDVPVKDEAVLLGEAINRGIIASLDGVKDELGNGEFELFADLEIKSEDIKSENIKSEILVSEDVIVPEDTKDYEEFVAVDNEINLNEFLDTEEDGGDNDNGESGADPDNTVTVEISEVIDGVVHVFQYSIRPSDFLGSNRKQTLAKNTESSPFTTNASDSLNVRNIQVDGSTHKSNIRKPRKQLVHSSLKDEQEESGTETSAAPERFETQDSSKYYIFNDTDVTLQEKKNGENASNISNVQKVRITDQPVLNPEKKLCACPVCLKVFASRQSLKYHGNVHNPLRVKYQCRICNRNILGLQYLKVHEASCCCPWKCTVCGKSFKFKTNLAAHMREHRQTNVQPELPLQEKTDGDSSPEHMSLQNNQSTNQADISRDKESNNKKYSVTVTNVGNDPDTKNRVVSTEKKVLTCPICSKVFRSRYSLKLHQNVHNPLKEKQFQCNVCGKRVSCVSYLKNQQVNCNCSWRCDQCGKNFKLKVKLNAHMMKDHQIKTSSNLNCQGTIKNKLQPTILPEAPLGELTACKLQTATSVPEAACPPKSDSCHQDCTKNEFKEPGGIFMQSPPNKLLDNFQNDTTGKAQGDENTQLKSKSLLESSCQTNTNDKVQHLIGVPLESSPFEFEAVCQGNNETDLHDLIVVTPDLSLLKSDVTCLTDIKNNSQHHVDIMQGSLTSNGYAENVRKNSQTALKKEKKALVCPICSKVFTKNSSLKKHQVVHNPVRDKPFQCNICGKRISCMSYLRTHQASHTCPWKCDLCGRNFRYKSYMIVHMRHHFNDRPYKCDLCGKAFTAGNCLRKHRRIHTGISPYQCAVCQKVFAQKVCLDLHMVNHTGIKPYLCDVCGKAFSLSSYLTKHIRDEHVSVSHDEFVKKCDQIFRTKKM